MKADNATATKRVPGLPASAMPGYISFVFLASVGPFFFAFFGYLFATASSNDASFKPIETISYVYFVWLIIFLAFILRPAVNGRSGGVKLTRLVGYVSLGLYGAAFAASLAMLARGTNAQRFLSYFFRPAFGSVYPGRLFPYPRFGQPALVQPQRHTGGNRPQPWRHCGYKQHRKPLPHAEIKNPAPLPAPGFFQALKPYGFSFIKARS